LNSTIKKEKHKSNKKKREKEEKSKGHKVHITNENHIEKKKSSIFSALDKIDSESIEKTRAIEEKLRAGLIKSEKSKNIEELDYPEIRITEIKKEIEDLKKIKEKHIEREEFEEIIEISNKIIALAFSSNLKEIVNEEKKYLELLKNKTSQKPKKIEILVNEDEMESIPQELEKIDSTKEKIKGKSKKAKVQENKKFEKEKQKLMEDKEKFEQEKLKFEDEKEAFKWEKQMLEELKNYERDKDKEIISGKINEEAEKIRIEEKQRFEEEKLNFEKEKAKLEQEKQKLEEEREIFKQERLKFDEEKDAFKWEKQMFEEMKKHEINKVKKNDRLID
jgi:hypothetical protein